jgi:hypothetical protein
MHRRKHYGRRCGPFEGRRAFDAEEWLKALEEHQKDLEQEVADIADLIRRLKEGRTEEPAPSV